jgi:hypothetical protein
VCSAVVAGSIIVRGSVIVGDCREVMASMEVASVDAFVTDPPYGIGFMGAGWDHEVPGPDYWRAALRVAKPGAHLVAFGGTKKWHRLWCAIEDAGWEVRDTLMWVYGQGMPKSKGCLKPAWEPIILAAKPGAAPLLNIDACRIEGNAQPFGNATARSGGLMGASTPRGAWKPKPGDGRWPANLCFDFEAAAQLDEQSGPLRSGGMKAGTSRGKNNVFGKAAGAACTEDIIANTGGASRFFYCAKASKRERNLGGVNNRHPCVKPIALMRWLLRLVAAPGSVVVDPFFGSGSTGVAAELEGVTCIGIEREQGHADTARQRVAAWATAA